MRGCQRKNGTSLRACAEQGDLLPGMGTSDEPRGAWRPAWGRRRHRCCPALRIGFRDPPRHKARAPTELYLRLDLVATRLNSISSALSQKGWVVLLVHHFPQVIVPAPRLPGSSQTSSLEKLGGGSVPSVPAMTPLHRKKSGAQGPVSMRVGGGPIRPAYKSHLGSRGDAMPSGRASPHAGLGSSWPHAKAIP